MTSDTNRESEIFNHVSRLPIAERSAFLDEACGGDDRLRREVESLLQAHDARGSFLEASAVPATLGLPAIEAPGSLIGPYKLRERIGEGGFGVVFVAEQERPVRRKVALKVIKPGMDTRDVIARFEAERQALALMDHPNVARVLDAGTTESGRPYFVMELVQGVAITEFCDRNQLTNRDRLGLFADVCRAVQHAHQKGIIHRDLKPSNVLVTSHDGKPVAKVIDFGVSKALHQQLTEKTIYTAFGQMIGTPAYMSPEQAEMSGLGIDTRSDVYSLGVLLYELLTGQTPLDATALRARGYAEMLRVIREEEPPRPSLKVSSLGATASAVAQRRHCDPRQLRRDLEGELDWIVMKCLEKDRSRRYETAINVARDIERYLEGEPVEAGPPGKLYRIGKFARRHRVLFGTTTAILALLIVGGLGGAWLAYRESHARRVAQFERRRAESSLEEERRQSQLAIERAEEARQARDALRAALYAAHLHRVESAWNHQQFGEVRQLLDLPIHEVEEGESRGWEWRYWRHRLAQGLVQDSAPSWLSNDSIVSLETQFSGDGARLISLEYSRKPEIPRARFEAQGGGEVVVRHRKDQRELLRFQPFPEARGPLQTVIVHASYDGSKLLVYSECDERRLAVFDGATGERLREFPAPARPIAIQLSGAGSHLAMTYRLSTENEARDPAGRQAARVWQVGDGALVYERNEAIDRGQLRVALDAEGTFILRYVTDVDGRNGDSTWEMVDLSSGDVRWRRKFEDGWLAFGSWSRKGDVLVVRRGDSAARDSLQIWDALTGNLLGIVPLRAGRITPSNDMAIDADSKTLALLESDHVQLFKIPVERGGAGPSSARLLATQAIIPEPDGELEEVAFGSAGDEVVTRSWKFLRAWRKSELDSGRTVGVGQPGEGVSDGWFSPDGTRLACHIAADDSVRVWDVLGERTVCRMAFDAPQQETRLSRTRQFAWSDRGDRLLTIASFERNASTTDSFLRFWVHDANTGRLIWQSPHEMRVTAADLSPRGDRLVTIEREPGEVGVEKQTLRVWEIDSGRVLEQTSMDSPAGQMPQTRFTRPGDEIAVFSVAASPPARRDASAGLDWSTLATRFRFHDAVTLEERRALSIEGGAGGLDSRRASIFMWRNGVASFHNLQSGAEELRITHLGPPTTAWTPDGKRIATVVRGQRDEACDVSVWSVVSRLRLLTFTVPGPVAHVRFTSDGRRLCVAHRGATGPMSITSWDVGVAR